MIQPCVLDASLMIGWSFGDERGEAALALESTVLEVGAVVPIHFHIEVASAILRARREDRLTETDANDVVAGLDAFDLTVDFDTTRRIFNDSMALAHKYRLSIYDAAYLELALRKKLRLATLDKKLLRAATEEGIAMIGLAA